MSPKTEQNFSYTKEIKEEIEKFTDDENKSIFKVLIGINGSGKTTYLNNLEEEINDKDEINLINIPSEITLNDELLKAGTQKSPSILSQLINFIQELINLRGKFKYKIEENEQYERVKEIWDEIKSKNTYDDIHNHKKRIIDSNLIKLEEEKDLSLFNINDEKSLGNNISTGDKFYTLMLLLNDVLTVLKKNLNNQKTKKVILLIDEPEKFLHPTLISILGKILCQLYYEHNISLILTTHSPILLKSIVENSRYLKQKSSKSSVKEEDGTNIKEKDSMNKEYPNIILFKKDITNTEESYIQSNIDLFKKDNEKFELLQPALSHVINSLFAEKIILVEGIRDEAFVNILIDLINQKYEKYQYVLIIPVGGCDHMIKIGNIIKENYKINFFMILDFDDKNKKNNEDKLKKENFNEDKYFLVKSDIEDWMQRNLEITLRRNEKGNIEDLYKLYELDYDNFIKKEECKKLIEKIEKFLK